jgi:asparagine synthase (glutamine-hydrolysing)
VGNFFAIVKSPRAAETDLFARGKAAAQRLKGTPSNGEITTPYADAASFPRRNGAGAPLVQDAAGNWLCAVGTWFHADGFATGAEANLLKAFTRHGALRCAHALSGFFVIVIGEARSQTTYVITDLIGSRHAFMRKLPEGIALASSSLLLATLADATPDALAIEEFIRTGVIYEDRSFYQEVKKLAPASIYQFSDGQEIARQTYWALSDLNPNALDGEEAVEAFSAAIIKSAVLVRDVAPRLLCDLTGGYDSRALVASLLSAGGDFATTVTGAPGRPDVVVAEQLSHLTGKRHTPVDLSDEPVSFDKVRDALSLTDGEFDCVEYGLGVLPVHWRTAQQFDLSANGSFGEVARGYWWELLLPRTGATEPLDARKVAAGRYVIDPNSPQLFDAAATARLVEHFTAMMQRANADLADRPNTMQMDNVYLQLRMHRWQGRIASATDQLRPCLSPFMLRETLEVMLQATPRIRQRSLLVRAMLKRLQPRLAAAPLEHGYPAEPFGLANFYRFAPLLTSYGGKVWNKAWKMLGKRAPASSPTAQEPVRIQLWRDSAVRELLVPERMRLSQVLPVTTWQPFLASSRQAGFTYDQQWNRILSCEMALRTAMNKEQSL